MKQIIATLKPYLRWIIFGGTLFFLLKTCKDRWQEIVAIRIDNWGLLLISIALLVTLLAHIWSGWVWSWILKIFKQPVGYLWSIQVYLTTNIAKYLPGNVWHFYGRITAVSKIGGSLGVASLSVILEPLLMAASALIIALISNAIGLIKTSFNPGILCLQIAVIFIVLIGIHPRIMNPLVQFVSHSKKNTDLVKTIQIEKYPWLPLWGEIGFLVLRGSGFLLTLVAFMPVTIDRIPQILSVFSFAWLLGLIVPGAPGGLGIFEATTIALLDAHTFPPGIILSAVAIFRVISILAEVVAAGMALASQKILSFDR